MTTIAIVGAGPGLGAAIARRFGDEGHSIALVGFVASADWMIRQD
jgi:NAD(P)-dependent dehydrogenase (short-subunit alcohol dehydrogenase family)